MMGKSKTFSRRAGRATSLKWMGPHLELWVPGCNTNGIACPIVSVWFSINLWIVYFYVKPKEKVIYNVISNLLGHSGASWATEACWEVAVMLLLHWATSCRSNPDRKEFLWCMNGPSYWTRVTKTDFQSHGLKSAWHYCAKVLFAICNFLGGIFVRYHLHSVLIRWIKSTTNKGNVSFLYFLYVPVCLLSSFQNLN